MSELPGIMATVLRARSTLNVRKAARLPRSIPMVMYLKREEEIEVNNSIDNPRRPNEVIQINEEIFVFRVVVNA